MGFYSESKECNGRSVETACHKKSHSLIEKIKLRFFLIYIGRYSYFYH
jgi:hypothetical protein